MHQVTSAAKSQVTPSRNWRMLTLLLALTVVWFACGEDGRSYHPIRFAFSARMFTEVNESDAKATVKAWAWALASERRVSMGTEPIVLGGLAELRKALRAETIDGAAVTTEEFLGLEPELAGTNLFVSYHRGVCTEQYLLVVSKSSGISRIQDLRQRKLAVMDGPRATLGPIWLEVALVNAGMGMITNCFSTVLRESKLVRVVLPVYFGNLDACLVTRRGYETMCELNPQVRKATNILLTSPAVLPSLGFLRRNYNREAREALMRAITDLENSVAGTQVLTLFQSDQLKEGQAGLLESARELLAAHRRVCGDPGDLTSGKK